MSALAEALAAWLAGEPHRHLEMSEDDAPDRALHLWQGAYGCVWIGPEWRVGSQDSAAVDIDRCPGWLETGNLP